MNQSNSKPIKPWCVYIIRTKKGSLYTGITNNVQRRWLDHLASKKGAKFFRTSEPDILLLIEPASNRSTASRREAEIKKLSRRQKETLIRCQAPYPKHAP